MTTRRHYSIAKYKRLGIRLLLVIVALLANSGFADAVVQLDYTTLATRPYPPQIYTQGLEVDGNSLLVSSGGYGNSRVERRTLDDLSLQASYQPRRNIFAEGLTRFGESVYLLSWQNHRAWRLDAKTLEVKQTFDYKGEGWGLTHDDKQLIMSNGSHQLQFIDTQTFNVTRTLDVTLDGKPLTQLNELEYVDGRIWANLWLDSKIVRINPQTGTVDATLELEPLISAYHRPGSDNVLNGIAWDPNQQAFLITGKRWPVYFVLRPTPLTP